MRVIKKILNLLILIGIFFNSAVSTASATQRYADLDSTHWAYGAILEMTDNGLFKGTGTNENNEILFSPNNTVSRAEFIAVLTRYLFPRELRLLENIPQTEWYQHNYTIALEKGLFNEKDFSYEDLPKTCSRQEMAMLLINASQIGNFDLQKISIDESSIYDYSSISPNYKKYVFEAYSLGLMFGVDEKGSFAPLNSLSRAEAATVIYRLKNPNYKISSLDGDYSYEWSNGVTYQGNIEDGQANGQGIMRFNNIGVYYGHFLNGKRDGVGTFIWNIGDKYTGNWDNDKFNGYGKYTFADGYEITGEWEDNQIKVRSFEMSTPSTSIEVGEESYINILFEPINATEPIKWKNSNEKVVKLETNRGLCKIKGLSVGKATITAEVGSVTKKCLIDVTKESIPVTQISLNCGDRLCEIDDKFRLTVEYSPSNASQKTVSWKSENEKVAKVNDTGNVTCVGEGETFITATTNNGVSASCYVSVKNLDYEKFDGKWKVYDSDRKGTKNSYAYADAVIDIKKMVLTMPLLCRYNRSTVNYQLKRKNNNCYVARYDRINDWIETETGKKLQDVDHYEAVLEAISDNMILMEYSDYGDENNEYILLEQETEYYLLIRE